MFKFFLAAYDNYKPIPKVLGCYKITARDAEHAKARATLLTGHPSHRFAVRTYDTRHTLGGWGEVQVRDLDEAPTTKCQSCGDEMQTGLISDEGAFCEDCTRADETLVVVVSVFRRQAVASVRLYAVKRPTDEYLRRAVEGKARQNAMNGYLEEADAHGLTPSDLDLTVSWCPKEAL